MIAFVCPHCGNGFEVEDSLAGRDGWCRVCKNAVAIPGPGSKPWEQLSSSEQHHRLGRLFQHAAGKADKYRFLYFQGREQNEELSKRLREMEALKKRLHELEQRTSALEQEPPASGMSALSLDTLTALQQSVDHVWEEIAAERVGRDALCGRIAQWESEQGTRKERLDKIEQDMGTIRISSQEAESNLLALGERIETESVKRQEMLSAIEQFEDGKQNLGVVLERVEGLQRGLSELQAIQESIGRHEIELGRLKEQLRETGERLVSAAALGDRIERVQCDLEAGLTAIHAELDTIRPELSALRTSMEEPDRQDSEDAAARCGADAGDRDTRIALATSQAETDSGKVSSPEEHEHQDISPGRQVLIGSFFHFMRPSPKVSDLETGGHM